uniref:Uncharacterized protein n=1 Tax=Periophthalmus magnuspinnatus TaxID=409849 RepID=A0A3B4AK93_9GOBI
MAAVQFCGEWFICSCDKRLLAVHCGQDSAPFQFDCGAAEKRPKKAEADSGEHEGGSDQILAIAASGSGTLLALSDDSKRLVLLRRDPTWTVLSVRWLARRCTALAFTWAEDSLLVADKSGDVYSVSVKEPAREPELQLGHLSMVLDLTVSVDDRFIVTCDRDEKIRVSWSKSPYNIQSFCLGWVILLKHKYEFVCLRVKQIQLLSLEQTEGGTVLRPYNLLPLKHYPLDVTFDPQGRLWVLLNCAEQPVEVYARMHGTYEQVCTVWLIIVMFELELQLFLCVGSSLVPEGQRSSSRLEHLYVETYDNVSEYMKKKQQRLEQQSQKRSQDQSWDHKRSKKSKTESKTETNGS